MNLLNYIYERILLYRSTINYARYKGVTVGENCRIFIKDFGSEPFLIKIGNNVSIASGVKILTHDGSGCLMNDKKGRRYLYQPVEIGNNVFIGVNVIIMPGVIIEDNVIVAPGSVVTKSVPTGSIVAGIPAKIIDKYESLEKKMLTTYISKSELDLSLAYKERILKVTNNNMKPFIK